MHELNLTMCFFEVNSRLGLLVSLSHWYSFVLDFHIAVSTLNSVDHDDALVLIRRVSLWLFLLKHKHARLVIVQNSHTRASVLSK